MDRRTLAYKISARRRVRRLALLALAAMLVAQSMLPALCAGASSYPAAGDRRRSALAIDPGAPDTYSAVLYDNANGLPPPRPTPSPRRARASSGSAVTAA